ncbi:hypothetical protein CLIB1423_01S12200 [[Candida] railenensis]|uniref:Uncharacterized protein n=1 Tax=[Candida] railenensis TaxID=45579 RepID=A0A9P0QKV9_9ASCO|nr:hypothetical protein CLIB1423_01S12200 [[Candida] railenensis]
MGHHFLPTSIPASMSIENVFLDQTFQLYKANGSPSASFIYGEEEEGEKEGFSTFLENFAKFLYNHLSRTNPSILQSTSELISSINDYKDLLRQLRVTKGRESTERTGNEEENEDANAPSYSMIFFSIRHSNLRILQKQSVVFITKREEQNQGQQNNLREEGKNFSTIVLVRASNPSISEGLLTVLEESVQLGYPLVIKPERISQGYIKDTINKMSEVKSVQEFGDVELSFQTSNIVGDSLRQVSVCIPQADLERLNQVQQRQQQEQLEQQQQQQQQRNSEHQADPPTLPSAGPSLVAAIFSHLQKITALNLNLVPLSRFTSQIVNISQEGKIKIHRGIDGQNHEQIFSKSLVWRLLISLFNK